MPRRMQALQIAGSWSDPTHADCNVTVVTSANVNNAIIPERIEPSESVQNWYAMKVFQNKSFKIEAEITRRLDVECYVPRENTVTENADGKRVTRIRPAIAGLLFVKAPEKLLHDILAVTAGNAVFYNAPDGNPAIIPQQEMTMFRLVTSTGDSKLEYLSDNNNQYSVGQHVRVLQGPFAGAEGHICRIRGNRRLVVSINGICAVATSYIPACFLEKIT